jgi:predicted XRE-type DNA-binding protein
MSKSVWNDIYSDPRKAALMQARSELMMRVQDQVKAWKVTQGAAASRLGVTQPRVNDLLNGKLSLFSLDALYQLAGASGLHLAITAQASANESAPPAPERRARRSRAVAHA